MIVSKNNLGKLMYCILIRSHFIDTDMNKLIYLLEDNKDISELIEYLLHELGHDVAAFFTVTDFKLKMKKVLPDLIVLDVLLPDGNGLEVCRELKADLQTEPIPVLLMSAHVNKEMASGACAPEDFISKPFDITDFADRVQRQIA